MSGSSPATPKQVYPKKGRKPKATSVDDYCRVCKCSLKNKYGSLGSFVNVFKETSRAEFEGFTVAIACEQSGILKLKQAHSLSTRICAPCCRKVKTFCQLHTLLSSEINKPGTDLSEKDAPEYSTKRLSNLTPGKSPPRKAIKRLPTKTNVQSVQVNHTAARKRILCTSDEKEEDHDNVLSNLNIEDIA